MPQQTDDQTVLEAYVREHAPKFEEIKLDEIVKTVEHDPFEDAAIQRIGDDHG